MAFLFFCILFCLIGILISRNPVHSVLWLISLFLCVGLIFFFLDEGFYSINSVNCVCGGSGGVGFVCMYAIRDKALSLFGQCHM